MTAAIDVLSQRLYLVRHGQTTLNAAGRLRGRLDPPLDGPGRDQVDALAAAFASLPVGRPSRVVAGPLVRTQQTATAIAARLNVDVLTDDRLTDRDYGPWTGEPVDQVRAQWGQGLVYLPGAEPVDQVAARARSVLEDQIPYLTSPVILVAHDAINSLLLSELDPSLGPAHEIIQDTACWNGLDYSNHHWHVTIVNGSAATLRADHDHLANADDEEK
jgi:broad specificity phosphatase PhoE